MSDEIIANRYAEAFVALSGKDKTKLRGCIEDLEVLCRLFEEKSSFYKILTHPLIRANRKIELIHNLFKQSDTDEYVVNLLCVLAKYERMYLFPKVLKRIRELFHNQYGIKGLTIRSAVPLNPEERARLFVILGKKFGNVAITEVVDKSLMGGILIHFGDHVIDASIRSKLYKMQTMMREIDNLWLKMVALDPAMAL